MPLQSQLAAGHELRSSDGRSSRSSRRWRAWRACLPARTPGPGAAVGAAGRGGRAARSERVLAGIPASTRCAKAWPSEDARGRGAGGPGRRLPSWPPAHPTRRRPAPAHPAPSSKGRGEAGGSTHVCRLRPRDSRDASREEECQGARSLLPRAASALWSRPGRCSRGSLPDRSPRLPAASGPRRS